MYACCTYPFSPVTPVGLAVDLALADTTRLYVLSSTYIDLYWIIGTVHILRNKVFDILFIGSALSRCLSLIRQKIKSRGGFLDCDLMIQRALWNLSVESREILEILIRQNHTSRLESIKSPHLTRVSNTLDYSHVVQLYPRTRLGPLY